MKTRIFCLLLLSACADKVPYDYGLTWLCLSPEGCERTEELMLIDRLNVQDDFFYLLSTVDEHYSEGGQRLGSESLPAGCWWLYGVSLFGQDLGPSKLCRDSGGFDLELSIPNRNPATQSRWIVKARDLGII